MPKPIILMVDDEPDQCQAVKNYFSRRNFLVLTTAFGKEALALIRDKKPDLVLLDMKLSGQMEGKDVLRQLRGHDKETKVVMVTGDILSEQEISEINSLGIIDILNKPVDFKTLDAAVKQCLKSAYPQALEVAPAKPQEESEEPSLKNISHDLSNITSDIANRCELYLLDTEEGLYKDKSKEERLKEAVGVLKSVMKSSERLKELVKKISALAKKEI